MSLVSWYPLNKDFKDYGFNGYNFNYDWQNVKTVNGKLGDALDCTSNSYKINKCPLPLDEVLKEFSICFWVNPLGKLRGGNCVNIGDNWGFRIRLAYVGKLTVHFISDGSGVIQANDQNIYTSNITQTILPFNTWTHVAVVYGDSKLKCYLNGQLDGMLDVSNSTIMLPSTTDYMYLGGSKYTSNNNSGEILNGYLNDVRIYDNALSELEIKEISQGLMLHYDFEDPYAEPTVNIPHTLGFSNVTKGSDENGDYFIKPQGATWASGLQLGGISIEPDTYYTWSIDVMPTTDAYIMFDPSTVADNYTGNDLARSGWRSNFHNVKIKGNEWTRVSMTVKTKADAINIKEWSVFCPDSTYAEMKVYYKNSLYEKKPYNTPYTATQRDADLVYDSSGFNNHGVIEADTSPNWCFDDVKQGKYCIQCYGKDQHILTDRVLPAEMDAVTLSCWAYHDNWSSLSKDRRSIVSCVESGGFGFIQEEYYDDGISVLCWYKNNNGYRGFRIMYADLTNGWHHFTMIADKNSLICYIDGKYYKSNQHNLNDIIDNTDHANGTAYGFEINPLVVGAERDGYNYLSWSGKIDDVRLYATALSAEDVLSLYQSKAKVDIKGNLHCSQLVETNNNSLTTPLEELPITGDLTNILYKFYSSGSFTFEDGVLKYTFAADNTTHSAGFYISPKTFKKQVNSKYYYKYSYWIRVSKEATYAIGFEQVEHIYKKLEPGKWYHIEGESLADGAHSALVFYNNSLNVEAGDTIEIRDPLLYELGDTPSDYDSSVTNEYQFKTFELNDTIDSNFTSYPSIKKYDADWVKVFHHNINNGTEWFADENEALYCNTDYKYSILKFLEDFRQDDDKFEFLLEYPQDFPNEYNRWKQTANPATTDQDPSAGGPAEGFEEIHLDWKANNFKGLLKSKHQTSTGIIRTFIDGTTNYPNWFYAIGCYNNSETDWHNRMPGPYVRDTTDGNETVHEVILYARAKKDNLHNLIINKHGARWAEVFYHNNKNCTVFFENEEEALHTYSPDKFSILDQLEMFRGKDGKFEFLLEYPEQFQGQYNRWKQIDNPTIISEVIDEDIATIDNNPIKAKGYEPIHIDWQGEYWGGLLKHDKGEHTSYCTLIDGSIGNSHWYYAIGEYSKIWIDGKLPGPVASGLGGSISEITTSVHLYVRIDNLENFKTDTFKVYSRAIDTHEVIEI